MLWIQGRLQIAIPEKEMIYNEEKSFVNIDTRFRDYFGDSSIILYGITGLLWDCLRRRGSAYCHECADPDSCLYGAYCAGYLPGAR